MPIATDHATAVRKKAELSAYLCGLDEQKRAANALGLAEHVDGLRKMIDDAMNKWLAAGATVEGYERQETDRPAARLRGQATEQLMLRATEGAL